MFVDGCPAAAGRDHEEPFAHERSDHSQLAHADGCGTADDPSQVSMAVRLYQVPVGLQFPRAFRCERSSDELRRVAKRRICRIDLDLGDDRRDAAVAVRATKRILERLLDHVADPARRCRDEHAQRKRTGFLTRCFVSYELVAHLRSVAMNDANAPTLEGQVDNRAKALACVAKLVVDRGALTRGCECVASERDDRRAAVAVRTWRIHRGLAAPIARPSASNAFPKATQSRS